MPTDPRSIGDRLIAWYRVHARDLPWRRTRDPYAIWVSETMLQQTTVAAVMPRYAAFLEQFPNVRALARADEAEVLAAVQGLGYYRRFRHLKRAAEICVEKFAGRTPTTSDEWRELPGVGPYMVGAIRSIAADQPEPAVDGNVCRVLSRFLRKAGDLLRPAARREIESYIREMMQAGAPAMITQALFDIGAGVCVPRDPSCLVCPLRDDCRAFADGVVDQYPEKKVRAAMKDVVVASAFIVRDERMLIVRRPNDLSLMPDFWEAPAVWEESLARAESALCEHVRRTVGIEIRLGRSLAEAKHTITHHRLRCRLYAAEIVQGKAPSARDGIAWIEAAPGAVLPGAMTSITTKLLRAYARANVDARASSPRARRR